MPLCPLSQLPSTIQTRTPQMLPLLDGLEASEQLEVACLTVLTALSSVRARFEKSQQDQMAFDLLCSDVETWLRREIEAVRFVKSQ
jgi:hypothetical protein